ncbi:hypothetical protein [Rossellomorea vietnamensis]|uniref:DNA mismatch repair protein MutT n=1 Tax=Rossellomorea vietnamensis TaxID=218284 RepID=A0A0N8GH80_9BACI|nr:hypothetical protein [Rossellomorea vietnamensis]KPL60554.1 DNA mismatch repair protein MutT [Rossellomorea vietnamensis]
MNQPNRKVTKTGTDIDEVKRRNANSGLTYNQVKQMLGEQYTGKK